MGVDDSEALLYELFEFLRRARVPIGVGDYLLAVRTLRRGVGLEGPDRLRDLCRLLWAKSREDQELLDLGFEELVRPRLRPAPLEPLAATEPAADRTAAGPERTEREAPPERPPPASSAARRAGALAAAERLVGTVPLGGRSVAATGAGALAARGVYQLTPRPPLTEREMASIWRHLRRLQRAGPAVELDVEGTVEQIGRTGALLQPVFQPRRQNQARLLVLVDRSASMVPFGPLVAALLASTRRGGLLGHTATAYFENCPAGYLTAQPGPGNPRPLDQVLAEHAKGASVLIVSDAGAARGRYRSARVACTRAFLQAVGSYTYRYAWLNPLPRDRWPLTTAEDVARLAPMYPLDREGLIDTVSVLRGRPFPPGVGAHARP